MPWSSLGAQFCLELAFGVLVSMAFVARAPLGVFFFRLMGATALVPLVAAIALPRLMRDRTWGELDWLGSALAAGLYFVYSGPVKARTRELGLGAAAAACAVSLALLVRDAPLVDGGAAWTVASFSAFATGLVGGSVGLAMVFGHWYLTVPALDVAWLVKLNRLTMLWMGLSAAALVATCLIFAEPLRAKEIDLFGPWSLFYIGTRVALGVVLPLLFAWMTSESLRYRNTRSATGILYASTVLVLIGTAVSLVLQDSWGAPL
jgi:hypothetical protein